MTNTDSITARASSTLRRLVSAPATKLHRSPAHAQMVAEAPPPSTRVLQPGMLPGGPGGPHSLVTTSRSWNTPLVATQAEEVGGQTTDQDDSGLNPWQWRTPA